jgi:hypothetical protein
VQDKKILNGLALFPSIYTMPLLSCRQQSAHQVNPSP